MTDRKQALTDLLEKVEAGEALAPHDVVADRPFFEDYEKAIHAGNLARDAYNGSLDAAEELHEAVLPGFSWKRQGFVMTVTDDHTGWGNGVYGSGRDDDNPARAWLIAILKALIAKEDA
jgi:hypothetical protein